MAIIPQGITGALSGKVGNLIGGSWKGIPYVRIRPASVANPNTVPQQQQRTSFLLILRILQALKSFINQGFKAEAIKMSAFNAAMKFNLLEAITGVFPNLVIDFSALRVSIGSLEPALNPSLDSAVPNTVDVSWDDNSGVNSALATDIACIAVYNSTKEQGISILDSVARSTESATIPLPASWQTDTVHTYLSFYNAATQTMSNSAYAGTVVVL